MPQTRAHLWPRSQKVRCRASGGTRIRLRIFGRDRGQASGPVPAAVQAAICARAVRPELCHEVLDVGLGRPGGDHQPGGDVPAGQALGAGVDLDERGVLVGEVRAALTELLTALDEPLPPACTGSARARPDLQPQLRGEVRGQASDTARTVAI